MPGDPRTCHPAIKMLFRGCKMTSGIRSGGWNQAKVRLVHCLYSLSKADSHPGEMVGGGVFGALSQSVGKGHDA